MLVRLTPLLGVVAGIALSVVLVGLAVLLALRLRGGRPHNGKKPDKNGSQKPPPTESEENNPDIIPLNNGISLF